MKKKFGLILASSFLLCACQTTSEGHRLKLSPVSLDKGDEFVCISGTDSYLLAKNKVLKLDLNGKKHDQIGIIVGVEKEVMKDQSINYSIRFSTREIFENGVIPEYSYKLDYITFNSELNKNGFMSGVYLVHMMSFPSVPDSRTLNIKKKAYCEIQANGYELMTNAEINLNFNDNEQF